MATMESLMRNRFFMIKEFENYGINIYGQVKNYTTGRILKSQMNNRGYYVIDLYIKSKRTHKLIHQLLAELFIPNPSNKQYIDHIDRNSANNKLSNLRWCTISENNQNMSKRSDNKSGITGVTFCNIYKKWHVRIHINGNKKHIGYFRDKEEATHARNEAEILYFGEFRRE